MTERPDFQLEAEAATELVSSGAARDDARWPQTLVDLVDVQRAALMRLGEPEGRAEELAQAMVLAMALYQGGRHIYLPSGRSLQLALRDDAIFRQHRRGNTEALSRKYGLTERQIERIVSEQTRLHRERIQPRLFE